MGKKSYSETEQNKRTGKACQTSSSDDGGGSNGSGWIRSLSKKDLSLMYQCFNVVANYSLNSDPLFVKIHEELEQSVLGPRTAIVRSSKGGSLENHQRSQPFLHMLRNVSHRREIDAFIVVAATCHRCANKGSSPTAFSKTPKDPEGLLRKSVTTGKGNRAISEKDAPHVITLIRSFNSFDELFANITQHCGTGKLVRTMTSSEVFFTRLKHFADGLSPGPAVLGAESRNKLRLEASTHACEQQDLSAREAVNAASHRVPKKNASRMQKIKQAKKKRKNSQWLNRLLVATTTWNPSVRSRAERLLLGRHFRGLAETLGEMKSRGDTDPSQVLIDTTLLISIVLARDPITVARSSMKELGIGLEALTIRKRVRYPKKRFTPRGENADRYIPAFKKLELAIPTVLSQILMHLHRLDLIDPNSRLEDNFKGSEIKTKKVIKSRIRQLADELGMPRIGLDQFAQQLVLYMNDDVGDENGFSKEATNWQIFCILGAKHHLPPVGAHYETVTDDVLSEVHDRSTNNYFEGRE